MKIQPLTQCTVLPITTMPCLFQRKAILCSTEAWFALPSTSGKCQILQNVSVTQAMSWIYLYVSMQRLISTRARAGVQHQDRVPVNEGLNCSDPALPALLPLSAPRSSSSKAAWPRAAQCISSAEMCGNCSVKPLNP